MYIDALQVRGNTKKGTVLTMGQHTTRSSRVETWAGLMTRLSRHNINILGVDGGRLLRFEYQQRLDGGQKRWTKGVMELDPEASWGDTVGQLIETVKQVRQNTERGGSRYVG